MKHFKKISNLVLVLGLSHVLSACGSEVDSETSQTESLTGGFGNNECLHYGANLNAKSNLCLQLKGGISSSVVFEMRGLTDSQLTKVRGALTLAANAYNNYWVEAKAWEDSRRSPDKMPGLLKCLIKNSRQDFDPRNSSLSGSFSSLEQKAIWSLTTLQFAFKFHKDKGQTAVIQGVDVAQTPEQKAGDFYTLAQAFVGNDSPAGDNLHIEVNRKALDLSAFSEKTFAGTLVHEWLHRRGYEHKGADAKNPEGYANGGSLVTVMGDCIKHDNNPPSGASLLGRRGPKEGGG